MTKTILACVLAAVLAAGGCGKGSKSNKTDAPAAGEGSSNGAPAAGPKAPLTDKQIGDAQRQAAKFLEDRNLLESVQPGEPWQPDPENPDDPKPSPMQQKFYRLRDGLTWRQVEQVMGGKPAEAGEVCPGGAKWSAWNEESRRFIVLLMNGRCMLRCSYDSKDTNGRYNEFQQVKVGMTKAQVRKLMGESGTWMGSGLADVNGGTSVYGGSDNGFMIFFIDDKVSKIIK